MTPRRPLQTDLRSRRPTHRTSASPPRRRSRVGKALVIGLGATILCTAALYASDGMRIPGFSFLGGLYTATDQSLCPDGMVHVAAPGGGFCVDRYEASPGRACAKADTATPAATEENMRNPACSPVSVEGGIPWTNVTISEAQTLCARAGKRLPVSAEWFRAALGTPDDIESDGCVLGRTGQMHPDPTGMHAHCVSGAGARDMVGNVWEWVEETVVDGRVRGGDEEGMLPIQGFIFTADTAGWPLETNAEPQNAFNGDYLWVDPSGSRFVFRGGYWGMDEKAGVYTLNVTSPASFVGVGVGFRCVR